MIALRRHTVFFFFFFVFFFFTSSRMAALVRRVNVLLGEEKKTAGMISLFGDRHVEMCIISFSAA